MRSFIICVKYNYNYKVEEDEMGGTGGMNGEKKKKCMCYW
jgi:hypothetical protein